MTMTTTIREIPAAAKSFSHVCKKCDTERYHKVLVRVSDESAKIECEICHKKSTFNLKKTLAAEAKKNAPPKKSKARAKKPVAPVGPSWEELKSELGVQKTKAYRIAERFEAKSSIEHPKFGVGFVTSVSEQRIEVMFEDGRRTLIHNHASK